MTMHGTTRRAAMKRRTIPLAAARWPAIAAVVALAAAQVACGPAESTGTVGPPVASFSQDRTGVLPGQSVQFTDTSAGRVTAWSWDFGSAGVSGEQHPSVTFAAPGQYTVRLMVSGPSGVSSVEKVALIEAGAVPTAALSCTPRGNLGYAPWDVTCTDESIDATSRAWEFGDGGTSSDQVASHRYLTAGTFTVRLTASNAVGSAQAETTITVHELDFTMEFDPDTGDTAPSWVLLTAIDVAGYMDSYIWYVDGAEIARTAVTTLWHFFQAPGDYVITLLGLNTVATPGGDPDEPLFSGNLSKNLTIEFAPPTADFDAEVAGGFGPFEVAFDDLSGGVLEHWEWTFGDGASCAYPTLPDPVPAGMVLCAAASATHVYAERGRYDVSLAVTGYADEDGTAQATHTKTKPKFVTVFLEDAGFELQTAGAEIGGAWEAVPGSAVTPPVRHIALSRTSGGGDLGMPSDYVEGDPDLNGSLWAVVEGQGTDGSTAVADIDNGIRQSFLHDPLHPVLEFDYVLLYAEPPASPVLDATIATVTDGVDTFEIPGSHADPSSPYAGTSSRYPTRDGSKVQGTPVRVASVDLAEMFPSADADTLFTLMIRTTNAENGLRSPLVYVDDIRFAESAAAPVADFETGPGEYLWAGEPVSFTDRACSNGACIAATSWLWDFGTHGMPSSPSASGSALRSPTYVYAAPGSYSVKQTVRRGGQEDSLSTLIDVDAPLRAAFTFTASTDPGPLTAPATLDFEDTSTHDVDDPIIGWSWDFGGWGTSAEQSPTGIGFLQAGTYTVTLTVTSERYGTDEATLEVIVE